MYTPIYMDNNYDKIIKLDKNNIGLLFWYINYGTELDHIIYNGMPYYELSNEWCSTDIEKRPDYDLDIECTGYDKCTAKVQKIAQEPNDTVEYIYSIDKSGVIIDDTIESFDEKNYEANYDANKQFLESLNNFDHKKILISGYNLMRITNSCGYNRDHRGSTHCRIDLKFEEKIDVNKDITLYDLVQIYYRTKSHKFDKNYEMFVGYRVIKRKDNFYVDLVHDHGS